jgi:hypothetical protein
MGTEAVMDVSCWLTMENSFVAVLETRFCARPQKTFPYVQILRQAQGQARTYPQPQRTAFKQEKKEKASFCDSRRIFSMPLKRGGGKLNQ